MSAFEAHRNQSGGFWFVSASEAARHAITWRTPVTDLQVVLAVNDGVAVGVDDYGLPDSWRTAVHMATSEKQTCDSLLL